MIAGDKESGFCCGNIGVVARVSMVNSNRASGAVSRSRATVCVIN